MKQTLWWIPVFLLVFTHCSDQEQKAVPKVESKPQKAAIIQPKPEKEKKEAVKAHTFERPNELIFDDFSDAEFCKELICSKEKFYPVGWTKKGYFVYFRELPPDFAGTIITLIVQDLTTDEKLIEKSWEGEAKNLQEFIQTKSDKVSVLLKPYDLVESPKKLKFSTFPLKVNGISYRTKIEVTKLPNGLIKKQKTIVKATSKGSKEIHSFQQKGDFGIVISKIIGCYLNPSKDKMVILQLHGIRGVEDSRVTSVEVIGCRLGTGFDWN